MQSEPNPNPNEPRRNNEKQPNPPSGANSNSAGDTFDVFHGGARRRVVADQLALSLWHQVRDLSMADRHLVFRALVTRTGARASTPRVHLASAARAACCADHGHRAVSRREYDA